MICEWDGLCRSYSDSTHRDRYFFLTEWGTINGVKIGTDMDRFWWVVADEALTEQQMSVLLTERLAFRPFIDQYELVKQEWRFGKYTVKFKIIW